MEITLRLQHAPSACQSPQEAFGSAWIRDCHDLHENNDILYDDDGYDDDGNDGYGDYDD